MCSSDTHSSPTVMCSNTHRLLCGDSLGKAVVDQVSSIQVWIFRISLSGLIKIRNTFLFGQKDNIMVEYYVQASNVLEVINPIQGRGGTPELHFFIKLL